ncbi:molybdopterin oxidoreductase family protein [Aquabacterium sp. A7-Y]|uniref:molybdopterin oxidoreductase family protein n=1 Tax=Aquabacterium sp. A7-Y TaxID=1349605 RepID=UPI00223E0A38|nr:molybdopterin oxidoreductase family protein [Aquabacterium sp. A7-Y]MCW7539204.1 molybdopterin oxidoreductase family protein [Aquabacterium sp. A7-Y]
MHVTQPAPTVVRRICPLCEASCGLELKVAEGRVLSIRGDDSDVFSAGYLCPKGVALKDLHEDPDRLRKPLVKRDGRFVEVSWDEAFAEIERRLPPLIERHGRNTAAVVLGNPSVHKLGLMLYGPRLLKALGTQQMYSASTLDQMPKQLSCGLMYGSWLSVPVPDIERCGFLLILGGNPVASNGSLWTVPDFRGKARDMQARGGRIVVVDPRRSETAELANEHLFIRPGGDVFFLLGLVHTLFDEQRVRLGRLEPHLAGVDEVRQAVAPYTPERVASRCGIDAATIRRLARELAAAPQAAVYGRLGTCTQEYGTLASWLVDVLNALTGHLDEPGGMMFPKAAAFAANTAGKPGIGRGVITGRYKSRVSGAPEVIGELPLTCLAEEIEAPGEDRVRALITIASNPVLSAPHGERLSAALDTLDFMVSVDIYLNETTRHADVILPGRSPLEDAHYDVTFSQLSYRNHARYSEPVFAPPAGQPAEWQVLQRLTAIVLGLGADADLEALDDRQTLEQVRKLAGEQADAVFAAVSKHRGPQRLLDLGLRSGPWGDGFGARPDGLTLDKVRAAPAGIDLGALQPRVPEVLRTPSGRIELAPPVLLQDLERVAADLERPAPPLVIVGRRHVRSNNSWMHNLPVLAKGPVRCTLLVHPADADRLGLRDGETARLVAAGGRSVEAPVQLSDEMMPGVVSLPHGWGHHLPGTQLRVAAERPGANLNALLDDSQRDPLSGNAVLSGVPVRLEPVAASAGA